MGAPRTLDGPPAVAYDDGMGKAGGLFVRRLAVAVATVLLSSFVVLGTAQAAHAEGEGTILSLVNQARAANNLGPLRLNSSISAVAAAWANQMAANGAMTHNPSYSTQIPGGWSRAAENVAMGYGSPSAVHDGWMNSTGHRANILGDFTDIGISFITSGGTTWAVENFAKYGASVPPPAPPAPPAPPPAPPAPPPAPPAPPPAPPAPPPALPPADSGTPASPVQGAGGSEAAPSPRPTAATDSSLQGTEEPSPDPSAENADDANAPGPLVRENAATPFAADDARLPLGLLAVLIVLAAGAWTGMLLRRRWRPRGR